MGCKSSHRLPTIQSRQSLNWAFLAKLGASGGGAFEAVMGLDLHVGQIRTCIHTYINTQICIFMVIVIILTTHHGVYWSY